MTERAAGRELDYVIAEQIMGLRLHRFPAIGSIATSAVIVDAAENIVGEVPHYSTEIGAAWLVVEKMRNPDFRLNKEGDWVCCFGGTIAFCGEADTAPLAICRAARQVRA